MSTQCNPMLVSDLLDSLLATAVRAARIITPADSPTNLLNVLPRDSLPYTTLTTINRLPWIDMNSAARCGNLWLLDTLLKLSRAPYQRPLQYDVRKLMQDGAARGHVHVLEWWQAHSFHCNVTDAASKATEFGHVKVLEWCRTLGKQAQVSSYESGLASLNGHVHILQWLAEHDASKAMSVTFCRVRDMAVALIRGDLAVADWWLRSGKVQSHAFADAEVNVAASLAEFEYTADPKRYRELVIRKILDPVIVAQIAVATCAMGDVDLIQLCLSTLPQDSARISSHNLPLAYLFASAGGHTHVLDFLLSHRDAKPAQPAHFPKPAKPQTQFEHPAQTKLPSSFEVTLAAFILPNLPTKWMEYTNAADIASAMNHRSVLDWWLLHCLPGQLNYSQRAVDVASRMGYTDILRFWHELALNHGSGNALSKAARHGRLDVLDWWFDVYPLSEAQVQRAFGAACVAGAVCVLDWFSTRFTTEATLARLETRHDEWGHWALVQWYLDHGGNKLPPKLRLSTSGIFRWPQPLHMLLGCLAYGFRMRPLQNFELPPVFMDHSTALFVKLCIQNDLLPRPIDLGEVASGRAVPMLDVLFSHKYPVAYSAKRCLENATEAQDVVELDWWLRSGLKYMAPKKAFVQGVLDRSRGGAGGQKEEPEIVKWWKEHWHLLKD